MHAALPGPRPGPGPGLKALPRDQSRAEELANSLSHALGFVLALASLPLLLGFAAQRANPLTAVALSVFSVTMMLLYGVSTAFHALPLGRAKGWLNRCDHASIYLFIAGSYTPFVLGTLGGNSGGTSGGDSGGGWSWALFAAVWACGLLGVAAKLTNRLKHPLWSTGLYVVMGWVAVVAAAPMVARLPGPGLQWLVAGGLLYTLGAIVFMFDARLRFAHFVWHLFVMGGSACHFFAVLRYAP